MKKISLLVVVFVLIGVAARAQDNAKEAPKEETKSENQAPKPLSAYKLQFVLRELQDGKIVNTREYAMVVRDNYLPADLKIGSRIPVKDEKDFHYLDIGTSIFCGQVEGRAPYVALRCTVEISNFALSEQKLQSGIATAPVLNQIRANLATVVEEGKQTMVSSIDDPSSTKRYEVAVTATKVK